MGYLTIKEETENRLHFCRQPSINSWGLLVGFAAVGVGISVYGNDPFYMKLIYMVLAVVIGMSCLDDWEECDLNKESGEVRLKKVSIWDVLVNRQQDTVVIAIDDVIESSVTEEAVTFFGKTYQVVLKLSHGASVGLTESFTFGSSSEHYSVAEKIRNFLKLDPKVVSADYIDEHSSMEETSDDSADDFEYLDKSELLDESKESQIAQKGSPAVPDTVDEEEQKKEEECVKPAAS